MLKGFKDFILRGNVIDLAVAVVMGAAFTSIVTAFTTSIIQPLINAVGSPETGQLVIPLRPGRVDTYIDVAAVASALINFLIVAGVVYFVIVYPLKKLKERRQRGVEAGPAEPTDIELLKEIRDLLAERRDRAGVGRGAGAGRGAEVGRGAGAVRRARDGYQPRS